MPSAIRSFAVPLRLGLICCLAASGGATRSIAEGYDSWSKVENAEQTRDYSQQLGSGKFEAAQQAFVRDVLLPQLALASNRGTIVAVRQRIREILTRSGTAPAVFEAANALAGRQMTDLARDAGQELIVRVNAMLLVGELQAPDRKPWAGGAAALAAAAADDKLPLAVRMAALTGLARHVAEGPPDQAFRQAAGPAITAIVTKPPAGDPAGVAWLVGKALDLAPAAGAADPVAAAAARMLGDEAADIDLRVRAAVALGRLAGKDAGSNGAVDRAAVAGQVRGLARASLRRELDAAENRKLSRQLAAGPGMPGGRFAAGAAPLPRLPADAGLFGDPAGEAGPGGEDDIPLPACRRQAWRLVMLADALQPADGRGGIAALLEGESAAEAAELAGILRRTGLAINARPDQQAVEAAFAALDKSAGPAGGSKPPPAADGPGASPFDQPGDAAASPFGPE